MIKKKHNTATHLKLKKLSQQAIKGIFSTKNHKKITMHQLKINHNSRCCGLISSLVQILYCKYVNVNVNIILSTPLRAFQG